MKVSEKNKRRLILGGALFAVATPGFALFGVGDIVFDPTSYASLVGQATTAINQLNTLKANVESFTFKQLWQTTRMRLENANVKNVFGETSGMNAALNTNSMASANTGWQMGTVAVGNTTTGTLQEQTAGNSMALAQLAFIENSDAISPGCLNAIGQYRAQVGTNATANTSLEASQLDSSKSTNSEVEQLNLMNAASAQQLTELQSQGSLHACLAAEVTLVNMQQRNAAATSLNDAAFIQTQQAANPTYAGNESGTWDSYLP